MIILIYFKFVENPVFSKPTYIRFLGISSLAVTSGDIYCYFSRIGREFRSENNYGCISDIKKSISAGTIYVDIECIGINAVSKLQINGRIPWNTVSGRNYRERVWNPARRVSAAEISFVSEIIFFPGHRNPGDLEFDFIFYWLTCIFR